MHVQRGVHVFGDDRFVDDQTGSDLVMPGAPFAGNFCRRRIRRSNVQVQVRAVRVLKVARKVVRRRNSHSQVSRVRGGCPVLQVRRRWPPGY